MVKAGGRSDTAVEGHGDLHEDEGAVCLAPTGEGLVEAASFCFTDADSGLDARRAQCFHAVAGYCRIGVNGGGDDADHAGGDKGLGAGRGVACVVAGLKGDVGCPAFGARACLAKRDDFGVVEEVVFVPAFTGKLSVAVEEDAADGGIGRGEGNTSAGEVEGALHALKVLIGHCCLGFQL